MYKWISFVFLRTVSTFDHLVSLCQSNISVAEPSNTSEWPHISVTRITTEKSQSVLNIPVVLYCLGHSFM